MKSGTGILRRTENRVIRSAREDISLLIFSCWFILDFVYYFNIDKFYFSTAAYYLRLLRPIKYAAILYCILLQTYSLRELVLIVPVTCVFVLSTRTGGNYTMLYLWMMLIMLKENGTGKVIQIAITLITLGVVAGTVLNCLGVLEKAYVPRGEIRRVSLGFAHPNTLGESVFMILAGICYFKQYKLWLFHYVLLAGGAAFVWIVPNSRTSVLCIFALVCFALFYLVFQKLPAGTRKLLGVAILCGLLGWILVSILLPAVYAPQKPWMLRLNNLLSDRLRYGKQAYTEFGVSLLGKEVYLSKQARFLAGLEPDMVLDNAYINILLKYGIIPFLLFLTGFTLRIVKCIRKEEYALFVTLLLFGVYMTMENLMRDVVFCFFLVSIADVLPDVCALIDRKNRILGNHVFGAVELCEAAVRVLRKQT